MVIPQVHELVLLLIGLNDGRFEGKTNVHKNLYILKEMLEKRNIILNFQFRPYFYGPYSTEISYALDILENSGLISTSEREFGTDDFSEIRQSIYCLSESGGKAFDNLKNSYVDFTNLFSNSFDLLKRTNYHQHTRILSTAAKIKLILSIERRPLNSENIKAKARELGWELNGRDINNAINVLVQTGLASVRKSKQNA